MIETACQLRPDLRPFYALASFAVGLSFLLACPLDMARATPPSPKRDINAVLAAHTKQLLALPDVVGVYIGSLEDDQTLCLKVMLSKQNPATERKIPHSIEGYPVRIEISGLIRPLDQSLDDAAKSESAP